MGMQVTILGSSSAIPANDRYPSAQVLAYENRLYLIDCGEGTQMQMNRYNVKKNRINHIFISHLHGDHYLGLMGLLSSYHLFGRKADLHIYAPCELENIIELQKKAALTVFQYNVIFHTLESRLNNPIYEDDKLAVSAVPLSHRIPAFGFIFREKPAEPKIYKEAINVYKLSVEDILRIKRGTPFYDQNGQLVPRASLVYPDKKLSSYAYISDTIYDPTLAHKLKGIEMLYHECTFGEDMKTVAAEKFHSTAMQAANIALKAGVSLLLLGHFSARYKTTEALASEARSVFQNVLAVEDGGTYAVNSGMKNEL